MINKVLKNNFFISFFISSIVFHIIYGFVIFNPQNIDWLMSAYHDWGTHYLGAAFYRAEPWGFPLGDMNKLYYPVGTNVGFTDSLPLLAVLTKLLSEVLPEDFQYLGIWLFTCTFFIAYYTLKICNLYKVKFFISILVAILVVLNPVFIFRGIHPALSAHFLILASIYHYLIKTNNGDALKNNMHQVVILFIASTINPYLALMVFGFNIALPIKDYFYEKSINIRQLVLLPLLSVSSILFFWIVFGMIQFKKSTDLASVDSFNMYSFNLNSFYNSYGHFSKFLPNYGFVNDKQYEGFAYFGLGILILIIISFIIVIFNIKKFFSKKHISFFPLIFICLLQFLFAITNQVTINDKILLDFPIPSLVEKLGFIFRASGRFVWPLYYLLFIISIIIFFQTKLKDSLKIIIICSISIIQIYDIQHLITFRDLENAKYNPPLNQKKWERIFDNFSEIITYPPFETSLNYPMDYQDLCLIALKTNRPIANGYVARSNIEDKNNFIEKTNDELNSNKLSKERLYVTTDKYLQDFSSLLSSKDVILKKRDNYYFVYNSTHKIDFLFEKGNNKNIDSLKTQFKSLYRVRDVKTIVKETNDIRFYLDKFRKESNKYHIEGWAFIESTNNNSKDSIFLLLNSDSKKYLITTKMYPRTDITNVYKKENLDNSGFKITISSEKIKGGEYSLGVLIKKQDGSLHLNKTNEKILISAKKDITLKGEMELDLNNFNTKIKSNKGLVFYENSSVISQNISLEKGNYILVINGLSYPEKPIKGENAHLKIKIDNLLNEIYLSNDSKKDEHLISFNLTEDKVFKLEIIFDNDISIDNKDRNALISSIKINKVN
jgi:hypothetical protein